MSIVEAIILGVVQGLTEFIPVSSSGHLLLLHEAFGTVDDTLAFDVMLHVGTLLALFIYFRRDILSLATSAFAKNADGRLARLLVAATVPAATAGLLLGDFIDDTVRSPGVVAGMLALVALLMLYADRRASSEDTTPDDDTVTTVQGMTIGVAQALALVPGTSRSGITMTVGMLSGLSRQQAARFSFLLAIPIIAGSAAGILLKDSPDFSGQGAALIAGVAASLISGVLAIRFFLRIVGSVGLQPFAYYRLALAALILVSLV